MAGLGNVEIKEIGKDLASAVAENRFSDARKLLNTLQNGVRANEEVLRATKIGQTVARLRTCEGKSVSQHAKDLVRTWKSKVESQREAKRKEGEWCFRLDLSELLVTLLIAPTTSASASPSSQVTPASLARPASEVASPTEKRKLDFEALNDKTRNACLKLIYQSLRQDGNESDEHKAYEVALAVELAVYDKIGHGEVTGEYRSKVRSLTLNLKDKKNPTLRKNVTLGRIKAGDLVSMTADELASEEQKAERSALQMQNLFNAKGAAAQEAETDAFECGRCKQRKCRYYQKQTRSADEPMTTFVTCTKYVYWVPCVTVC
jgi:transcription elongation factor S-II